MARALVIEGIQLKMESFLFGVRTCSLVLPTPAVAAELPADDVAKPTLRGRPSVALSCSHHTKASVTV
jgi:hypothetical protein